LDYIEFVTMILLAHMPTTFEWRISGPYEEEVNIDLQAVEVIGNNVANGTIKHYSGYL
jgi:hypothetical protein